MKQIDLHNKTIVISRTDSIGDVILTLPLCRWIKQKYPSCKLIFLGKSYTQPILECFPSIDQIVCWNEFEKSPKEKQVKAIRSLHADVFVHVFPNKVIAKLAKKAKIDYRIGTSHRFYHNLTCNIRPNFTRKNSELHESQLNFELIRNLGLKDIPSLNDIANLIQEFCVTQPLPGPFKKLIDYNKKNIIIHPKSQGSAVEWPIEKYIALAEKLVKENYKVYFSGTEKEGKLFRHLLPKNENIQDVSGRMTLTEFIGFINECDVLLACSTGPLHIASILGKTAIGLYTKKRPMHPGRWSPIGMDSKVVTSDFKGDFKTLSPIKDIKAIKIDSVYSAIVDN